MRQVKCKVKVKLIYCCLLVFSILLICNNLMAQTVIREKVKINPKIVQNNVQRSNMENSYKIIFEVRWTNLNAEGCLVVLNTNEFLNWTNSGSLNLELEPNCNGYAVQIRLNLDQGETSTVSYIAKTSDGRIIKQGSFNLIGRWDSFVYSNVNFGYPDRLFTTLSYRIYNSEICTGTSTGFEIFPACEDTLPKKVLSNIKLKLNPANSGIEFLNLITYNYCGSEIEIDYRDAGNYEIVCAGQNENNMEKRVELNFECAGITAKDTIIVKPDTDYYELLRQDATDDLIIAHGLKIPIEIYANSYEECTPFEMSSSIKYKLEIVKGGQYGVIENYSASQKGIELNNLDHDKGRIKFRYSAEGFNPVGLDTITIKVSTTSPHCDSLFVNIQIYPTRINVSLLPNNLQPGDTSKIILKRIEANGDIVNFSSDTAFKVKILDGKDYGTILYNRWGEYIDTTDNVWYEGEPFSFIAEKSLTSLPKNSSIIVGAIDENGDDIWGGVMASIGDNDEKLYLKADLNKETIGGGDTVLVSVSKIDKEGKPFTFPPGTLFEAKILEGCENGQLMNSSGEVGSYFRTIEQPFYFVVNSTIDTSFTNIKLQITVPEEGLLSFDEDYNKGGTNSLSNSIIASENSLILQKQTGLCSTNPLVNTSYDYAVGSIEKGCINCKLNEISEVPHIKSNQLPLPNYVCEDSNQIGKFIVGTYSIPSISACYDKSKLSWQIIFHSDIISNYHLGFCFDNINRKFKSVLYNIAQMDTIFFNMVKAYNDIENQKTYGNGGNYYVFEAAQKHEELHRDNFYKIVEDVYTSSGFNEDILKFQLSCNNQKYQDVIEAMQKFLKEKIEELIKKINTTYLKEYGEYGTERYFQKEKEHHRQPEVRKIYQDYQNRLIL